MTRDSRSPRERMLAGDPYLADDPVLEQERRRAALLTKEYNDSSPDDAVGRLRILRDLLGSFGEGSEIRPPFHCDYGYQISIGARTFVNFGLVALELQAMAQRGLRPDPTRHPVRDTRTARVTRRRRPSSTGSIGS